MVNDGAIGGGDTNIRTTSSDKLSLEVYPRGGVMFFEMGLSAISLFFSILPIIYLGERWYSLVRNVNDNLAVTLTRRCRTF